MTLVGDCGCLPEGSALWSGVGGSGEKGERFSPREFREGTYGDMGSLGSSTFSYANTTSGAEAETCFHASSAQTTIKTIRNSRVCAFDKSTSERVRVVSMKDSATGEILFRVVLFTSSFASDGIGSISPSCCKIFKTSETFGSASICVFGNFSETEVTFIKKVRGDGKIIPNSVVFAYALRTSCVIQSSTGKIDLRMVASLEGSLFVLLVVKTNTSVKYVAVAMTFKKLENIIGIFISS
mmetsp:Transcript_7555/g.10222  ORF Transcript_7555/g.10222 Transcript_7555/m.10222 type:complete len:239 (-) Transcript_7555:185-901(-)